MTDALTCRYRTLRDAHDTLVWALDFDGTLVSLASGPEAVRVTPDLPELLHHLMRQPGHRAVILTGRPASEVHRLLDGVDIPVIGNHGADLLDPAARPPASWVEDLRRLTRDWPGTWLEDKGPSLAFHWRQAADPLGAAHAVDRWRASVADPCYRVGLGRMVADIVPRTANKGAALVAWLTCRAGLRWRRWGLIVAGDDATDDDMFAVAGRAGLTIAVGPRWPTQARHRLPDPAALRRWMARMLKTDPVRPAIPSRRGAAMEADGPALSPVPHGGGDGAPCGNPAVRPAPE
jgi:trehalose 6-phosphate phosphatase